MHLHITFDLYEENASNRKKKKFFPRMIYKSLVDI